jgi:hypothetical protein
LSDNYTLKMVVLLSFLRIWKASNW